MAGALGRGNETIYCLVIMFVYGTWEMAEISSGFWLYTFEVLWNFKERWREEGFLGGVTLLLPEGENWIETWKGFTCEL